MTVTDGNEKSCDSLSEILSCNSLHSPRLNLKSRVSVKKLQWGEVDDFRGLLGQVDIILAADCLFFDDGRKPLLDTIEKLLSSSGKALLFAPSRHGTLEKFVQLAKHSKLFAKVDVDDDYDPLITRKHVELLELPHVESKYDSNLHYPMLVTLIK